MYVSSERKANLAAVSLIGLWALIIIKRNSFLEESSKTIQLHSKTASETLPL